MRNRHHTPCLLLAVLAVSAFSACTTQQEYAYLKNVPRYIGIPVTTTYNTTIFAGDRLHIDVFSQTPESTIPFNQGIARDSLTLKSQRFMRDTLRATNTRGYLVDDDGNLLFPLLGSIHAEGLTLDSLGHLLEQRLKADDYVADPLVTVKLMNFRVTVIGEVVRPSQLHGDGNRLTIFEALAQCGDVTMDGLRDEIIVVRRTQNGETVDTVDLTSRAILESPYYYLQQNDIVYVSPNEKKRKTAYRNEDWPSYMSLGTEAIRFAYTTIYRWFISPTIKTVLQELQEQ